MIELLVILIIVGAVIYFVNQHVPLSPPIRTAINIVVAIMVLVALLDFFGLTHFGFFHRRRW